MGGGSWPLPRLQVGVSRVMAIAKAAGGWWIMAIAKAAGGWWVMAVVKVAG